MKDSSMEWIGIDDEEEKSSGESKMSMIWNRGWRLGKTIVITGVAISSAPIVLPPLVVVSTLGFAFAVPFGFVFVSYICTEKLMSKLLSRPNPPLLMLEPQVEEEEEEEGDVEGDENREEFLGEDENENEFIDDTKEILEMGLGLIGNVKEEEEDVGFDVGKDEEPVIEDMMGVMEEEERRDNGSVDNYIEMEKPVIEYPSDIEEENLKTEMKGGIGEFLDEGKIDETLEEREEEKLVEEIMGDIEEEKKPIRETGEVLKEIGDEENLGKGLEDDQKMVEVYAYGFEEDEKIGVVEESRGERIGVEIIEEKNLEEGKPVTETNGVVEDSRDDDNGGIVLEEEGRPVQDMKGVIGEEVEGEKQLEVPVEKIEGEDFMREAEGVIEEGYLDENIVDDEKPAEEIKQIVVEMGDDQIIYDVPQEDNYIVIEEEKPVVDINGAIEEERRDDGKSVDDLVVLEENLDDNEVKPINEIKGIIAESVGGGNVDKSTEEDEITIEDKSMGEAMKIAKEMRDHEIVNGSLNEGGITVEEMGETMVHRTDGENVDKIVMVDEKGVIYEKGDETISDSMVEKVKKPIVPPANTEDAREIADESGLHFLDDDSMDADRYTCPNKDEVYSTIIAYYLPSSIGMLDNQVHPKHEFSVEEEHSTDNLSKEIADSKAHPVSSETAESRSAKGSFEENNVDPSKGIVH